MDVRVRGARSAMAGVGRAALLHLPRPQRPSRDPAGSLGCLLTQLFLLFHEVSKSVSTAEQQLWKKSFSCFEKGIHNFESIDDATNAALLLCNTGRLMRICAQAHCGAGDEFKREFSPEEGLYYNKVTHLLTGSSIHT